MVQDNVHSPADSQKDSLKFHMRGLGMGAACETVHKCTYVLYNMVYVWMYLHVILYMCICLCIFLCWHLYA